MQTVLLCMESREIVFVYGTEKEKLCVVGKRVVCKGKREKRDCVYGNKRKERSCKRVWKTEGDFACMKNGDCVFVEKRGIVCVCGLCVLDMFLHRCIQCAFL